MERGLFPERKRERKEGIVYSDYMGSGPGNKPSHGGNGYKIGSTVATVLSLVSVSMLKRVSRAYARAEQEQSDMEKAKRSVDEKRPVYESKKRVAAARPYDEMRGRGRGRRGTAGARGRTESRDEKKRSEGKGGNGTMGERNGERDAKRREPQHREPSYWNLNNNYSV